MQLLRDDFDFLEPIFAPLPQYIDYWYLIKNFRPEKARWRREWKRWSEEMPPAFKARSKVATKLIQQVDGQFDLIWLSGTIHAIPPKYNYVVFSDSTRKLSSNNIEDTRSQLSSKNAMDWFQLESSVYENANQVIVGAQYVKESLTTDYKIDPQKIHACGFPAGIGHANAKKKSSDGPPTILFVGKGDFEKKGGYTLLDAFKLVKKQAPEAKLILVGQKHCFEGEGIINAGAIKDRALLQTYYEQATLLAVPSLIDRFGMVFLEAMANGLPVIGSDYGAMPEIIAHAGYTIRRGDAKELSKCILKIIQNPELREEMSKNALIRFNNNYSDEVMKQKYTQIFNRANSR